MTLANDSKWADVAEITGINEKTLGLLKKQDVETVWDYVLLGEDDYLQLKEEGVSAGQMGRLNHACRVSRSELICKDDEEHRAPYEPGSPARSAAGSGIHGRKGHADGLAQMLAEKINIKDVRNYNKIDVAGNNYDHLLQSNPKCDDLLFSLPPGLEKMNSTPLLNPDDPRAGLVVRSTSTKTFHITAFLPEEVRARLRNKREQRIVPNGDNNLRLTCKDGHAYAGISLCEWASANMKLMSHLLKVDYLAREDVEFYLAYTMQIFDFADKIPWKRVLNYDFSYRERQAELNFPWGSRVSMMEMLLLEDPRDRRPPNNQYDQLTRGGPPRDRGHDRGDRDTSKIPCKQFLARGFCSFNPCKYLHPGQGHHGTPRGPPPASGTGHYPGQWMPYGSAPPLPASRTGPPPGPPPSSG